MPCTCTGMQYIRYIIFRHYFWHENKMLKRKQKSCVTVYNSGSFKLQYSWRGGSPLCTGKQKELGWKFCDSNADIEILAQRIDAGGTSKRKGHERLTKLLKRDRPKRLSQANRRKPYDGDCWGTMDRKKLRYSGTGDLGKNMKMKKDVWKKQQQWSIENDYIEDRQSNDWDSYVCQTRRDKDRME